MGPAGEARDASVWSLLGYTQGHAKPPYASQPFGDTPQETFERGRAQRGAGFRAVRFGWGLIAHGGRAQDADHIVAARDGIGPDGVLLVDTGRIFGEDVDAASAGLPVLQAAATWLEEPFAAHAHDAHAALARQCRTVRLAGSEGAHNAFMARHLLERGRVGFIQIDCGRIGGIGPAKQVAEHAVARAATLSTTPSPRRSRSRRRCGPSPDFAATGSASFPRTRSRSPRPSLTCPGVFAPS